jgi:peroxiredoxin
MKRTRFALWVCALLLLVLGGFAVADWQLGQRAARPNGVSPRIADRHYVSPQQLADGHTTETRDAPLSGIDQHGVPRSWSDLSTGRSVALVFVKDGCPCSVEFEPYFHRLAAAYPEAVRFVTIINGDVRTARRFADENHVPYPVLADEAHALITRFHAEHGATVVLLSASGKLEGRWPGCSREMMCELSGRIARISQFREEMIDVAGLPGALTAGCAYSQ